MPSLYLDLSHAGVAAVLDDDGTRVLARDVRAAGTRHEDVADWCEGLLRAADAGFRDLSWIVSGVGPGSFTGIRIALAFAQGLAFPSGIPVHGATSFEALFLSHESIMGKGRGEGGQPDDSLLAVLPATAGRFYVAGHLDDPGALVDTDALAARVTPSTVVLSPARVPAVEAVVAGAAALWTPGDAWDVAAIARHARRRGRGTARPVYLQLSAAEEKFGAAELP